MTNKKILPHYGTRVVVLPLPADSTWLRTATREQLAVLIALLSETKFSYLAIAEKSGATKQQIDQSIAYWQEVGVLTLQQEVIETPREAVPAAAAPKLERAGELPHYNTDEAARFLEGHPGAASLIDCCQQELGRMFTTAESEIILGLLDYLSMDAESILLLCAHCAKRGGKYKSLRYIEKMAISIHDAGVSGYEQVEHYLKRSDAIEDAEQSLRTLFGIGRRALTTKEKDAFARWAADLAMPMDVITRAYEIAVTNTGEPSVPYTNAILEKWHAAGYRTLAAVEEAEAARRGNAPTPAGSSFATDDFFEAALKRSYGDT